MTGQEQPLSLLEINFAKTNNLSYAEKMIPTFKNILTRCWLGLLLMPVHIFENITRMTETWREIVLFILFRIFRDIVSIFLKYFFL